LGVTTCASPPRASTRRLSASGKLRYPAGDARGILADGANVALLALMYAALPGVTDQRALWARCMAKQTVDYILGSNPAQTSFVVGFGCGRSLQNERTRLCYHVL
jgi:Glycosyl hydrolase family 9